jgi:hypothetical protein
MLAMPRTVLIGVRTYAGLAGLIYTPCVMLGEVLLASSRPLAFCELSDEAAADGTAAVARHVEMPKE